MTPRRLPLYAEPSGERAPVVLGERRRVSGAWVAVVGATDADLELVFATMVLKASADGGQALAAICSPVVPGVAERLRTAGACSVLDEPGGRAAVGVGVELALQFLPTLTVLLTGGVPRSRWTREARALAPSAELLLTSPRAGVASGMAALLRSDEGAIRW